MREEEGEKRERKEKKKKRKKKEGGIESCIYRILILGEGLRKFATMMNRRPMIPTQPKNNTAKSTSLEGSAVRANT